MRVKNVISKVKIKLKEFDYQKSGHFYTDEEILSFVNDAQNDIIIRQYILEGIENFNVQPDQTSINLPDYVGKIDKVVDNKNNVYEFINPKDFIVKNFFGYCFSLLNGLLLYYPAPSQSGAGSIIIYFKFSRVKHPANLIDTDLTIPHYYDKAIEYFVLSQLITGDGAVYYRNLYEMELDKRLGIFYTRAKDNRIIGTW